MGSTPIRTPGQPIIGNSVNVLGNNAHVTLTNLNLAAQHQVALYQQSSPFDLASLHQANANNLANTQLAALQNYANLYAAGQQRRVLGESEPPKIRTQPEIEAELTERFEELKRIAAEKAQKAERACKGCRWARGTGNAWCHNALVKGFDDAPLIFDKHEPYSREAKIYLCGSEKALWEERPPRLNIFRRIVDWFIAPWVEERA